MIMKVSDVQSNGGDHLCGDVVMSNGTHYRFVIYGMGVDRLMRYDAKEGSTIQYSSGNYVRCFAPSTLAGLARLADQHRAAALKDLANRNIWDRLKEEAQLAAGQAANRLKAATPDLVDIAKLAANVEIAYASIPVRLRDDLNALRNAARAALLKAGVAQ